MQSVIFGVCHAYQGATMILTISVYGALFACWLSGAAACDRA